MDINLNIEKLLSTGSVNESNLNFYKQLAETVEKSKLSGYDKTKEIEKAARGFESMFVSLMLKEMKKSNSNKEEDSSGETDSFGADTLLDYTDLMIADHISKTGNGIGIASKIYEVLTNGKKIGEVKNPDSSETNFKINDLNPED